MPGYECMSPFTHGGIGCPQCNRLYEENCELRRQLAEMVAERRVRVAQAEVQSEAASFNQAAEHAPMFPDL